MVTSHPVGIRPRPRNPAGTAVDRSRRYGDPLGEQSTAQDEPVGVVVERQVTYPLWPTVQRARLVKNLPTSFQPAMGPVYLPSASPV